jgi:hypothetical protein
MNRSVRLRCVIACLVLVLSPVLAAQVRQEIRIPDIEGYKTLKCDFHIHTVFSDGLVWPTVRVDEAWREGLDAIAITDHIEYKPHKEDVSTAQGRWYDVALPRAKERGILLIRGAEITKETPPGHFNAIFLDDVAPLDTNDLLDVMAAASKQGAFIWWNHPNWKPEHTGWLDIHTTLYEKKYMRGIEVVNGLDYDPEVHAWAMEKNLTLMGNSDIHEPSPLEKTTPERHRPMTLVFAKAKSLEAVKDALMSGRTAIWHKDQLIGRREYLQAIFDRAVQIQEVEYGEGAVRFALCNNCDVGVTLGRAGGIGPEELTIPPNGKALVKLKVPSVESPVVLSYVVKNLLIGPNEGLPINLKIPGQAAVRVQIPQKDGSQK